MLTLERKALIKAVTKEDAILEGLKTAFMGEQFKTLKEKSLKGKKSFNLDIKKTPKEV